MDRNREAFRNRFLAYKDGKSVKEIYSDIIPGFEDGKQSTQEWADAWQERLQPSASSKILQKWNATGQKPQPESQLLYTQRRIKDTTWKKPSGRKVIDETLNFLGGDVKQTLDAGSAAAKGNYAEAGLLGAGLLLPNAVRKAVKPIKRYISGGDIKKKMIDAARSINFTDKWDDDTAIRWMLNGEKTPDFKFVWHGRGTNRGDAKDVVRIYSNKDVGLHLTENIPTARKFAGDKGVVYSAIDYGVYPDAIHPDMGMWRAPEWYDIYDPIGAKKDVSNNIRTMLDANMNVPGTYKGNLISHLKYKEAFWDMFREHNISGSDLSRYSTMFNKANTDAEREVANKAFAEYLSERGVNFRYKNDFEGGGFAKPSSFVTDTRDIHWIPTKQPVKRTPKMLPLLDWSTGTFTPAKETL